MCRAFWIVALAVAAASGCGGDDDDGDITALWPTLQIDVVVNIGIRISMREVARPNACSVDAFLRTGCDETSDVVSCNDPQPAAWIDEVTLMSGDQVLETVDERLFPSVWFSPAVIAGHGDLAIVLVADDGQRVAIPIPATAPPQPAIDELTYDGVTLHVGWSATPAAASALVAVGNQFVGSRCHVPAPQDVDLAWPLGHDGIATVLSFAAPATTATTFGDAKVWIGKHTNVSVPIEWPSGLVSRLKQRRLRLKFST